MARRNLDRAKLSDRVEVRVGRASELLDAMQGFVDPFDFVFIDADKASSDVYFKAVLKLSRPGTVIIVDNVVREGKVADAASGDEDVEGIRRMTEWIATQPNISCHGDPDGGREELRRVPDGDRGVSTDTRSADPSTRCARSG